MICLLNAHSVYPMLMYLCQWGEFFQSVRRFAAMNITNLPANLTNRVEHFMQLNIGKCNCADIDFPLAFVI